MQNIQVFGELAKENMTDKKLIRQLRKAVALL
jgi:hypothetical protein